MSKEKLMKLTKYAEDVKSKLSSTTLSEKQKNRPVQYKQFLERELSAVSKQIEALKMSGATDKK